MKNDNRRRKMCVMVSQEAYEALQAEAFRLDRHSVRVAQEIVESAFLALKYNQPDALDELPEMEVES